MPRRTYRFEVYQDRKKEWRWRLWAPNGRKIADCAEGYKRKFDCLKVMRTILGLREEYVAIDDVSAVA